MYQYFYEGQRPFRSGGEGGIEYVFTVSADRKSFHPVSVMVGEAALGGWEQTHGHALSSTERYAICKMALFQAFDERDTPDLMKQDVRVRAVDVEAITGTLEL